MNRKFTGQESLFISYAKALGIIVVIIGHYPWYPIKTYNPYIFHMPFFFLIGGMLATPIIDWKKWTSKIVRSYMAYIVIWYVVLAMCAVWINKLFGTRIVMIPSSISNHDYFIYPLTQNMHNNSLFLAAWFFVAYVLSISIFRFILTLLEYLRIPYLKAIICLLGVVVGYFSIRYLASLYKREHFWLYNLLCQIGAGYMWIAIGFGLRNYLTIFKNIPLILISIVITVTFVGNNTFHPLVMAWSDYPDRFYIHLISSLSGSFGVFSISYILSLLVENRFLQTVGNSSKDIMTLHLPAFVIADLMLSYLGYYDKGKINGVDHYIDPSAWPLYISMGLFFPLLIGILLKHIARLSQSPSIPDILP